MHEKFLVMEKKASGTFHVSFKRQIVIPINLSLLELTSKVPEPFLPSWRNFSFNAIPTAYSIPFFTRNVQPFILDNQIDTLPSAKDWNAKIRSQRVNQYTYEYLEK